MPDRKLKPDELFRFVRERETGKLFLGLHQLDEEGTEPSLYDVCFLEVKGIAEAQRNMIIHWGRKIKVLQKDAENKDVILETQNNVLLKLLERVKTLEKKEST